MAEEQWHFWIDRGGTFTDVVARRPDGSFETAKLLSENPAHYDDAAVAAIRQLTAIGEGPLPGADIRIGTTIATNALLERRGEPVLLAITRGFGDALAIGTQERPDIFALAIKRPKPLPAEVLEIDERIGADGTLVRELDRDAALAGFRAARERGIKAVAIALMHGYRFTTHEEALAELALQAGFEEIAVSHRVSPLARIVGRADTTSLDAYLSPVLRRYVNSLTEALGAGQAPLFMQSNGGLTAGEAFRGKDAVLSGPAGGIVGMAETARAAGFERVIGFDMGGTSTDVSLFAGKYERDSEARVAGVRIRTPMMRIHTVAAGGGSVCSFDGARFTVGPESAGAQPGPACYRQGGPLTVTDCNLILGRLQAEQFPRVFGPQGNEALDRQASMARMADLLCNVEAATGRQMTAVEAAEGFLAIAVANMAQAIKAVSLARGHDSSRFALSCFGGAGGQHACRVADALAIETVLAHPLSGVLSAYGMGLADRRALREASLGLPLGGPLHALDQTVERLSGEARAELIEQGVPPGAIEVACRTQIRKLAGESAVEVPLGTQEEMRAAFEVEHVARFGYPNDAPLVIDTVQVEAVACGGAVVWQPAPVSDRGTSDGTPCQAHFGSEREVPVYRRETLSPDARIPGPALVIDPVATIVVEPGWDARTEVSGMLVLRKVAQAVSKTTSAAVDPVRLEIFGGLFMGIAEEMGAALQHSASSVNIRERLDFSCAIFDASGALIANAPHMPVHLGSMGDSVRAIIASRGSRMARGEVYALNAPYAGGTHLPDITVIEPVFAGDEAAPAYFVAARGHHADIGGIAPGSMPARSHTIEEEGVVLDDVLLVGGGQLREAELRELLSSGPWPARNIDQNLADLAAQVAACRRGSDRLLAMVEDYGQHAVSAYMEHLQAYADQAVRQRLRDLHDGAYVVELDNGARIAVRVEVDRQKGEAAIDFDGTSGQLPDNFNAPSPVVRAACLYAVRLLLDAPIPLNDGFLRPIAIRIAKGSMLAPKYPAAVVAGNVETSQQITDALLGAFGAMAASQGTMNNFTFGDATRQYYETVAGGAGAGSGFVGADVVQTHMTNSRLTDPEILEQRFPVRVDEFAIRSGSGGAGRWKGGDGAVRRIRFLEPMRAEILSGRRATAPFGLAGGGNGASGSNRVERANGSVEDLPATASVEMDAGDVFVIETPGGGGYGSPG